MSIENQQIHIDIGWIVDAVNYVMQNINLSKYLIPVILYHFYTMARVKSLIQQSEQRLKSDGLWERMVGK